MEKCNRCDKTFTRIDNLNRHKNEVCRQSSSNKRKRKGTQTNIIDPKKFKTNTDEFQLCSNCNVIVPKKFYASHLRSQNHKNNSCINTPEPGVQLLDCAFQNRIVTYRISPTRDHNDFEDFFKEIKEKVIRLVTNEVERHTAIKLNMLLVSSYILETKEIAENKSFNSKNKIITKSSNISKSYAEFKDELSTHATEFEATGSGKYNL